MTTSNTSYAESARRIFHLSKHCERGNGNVHVAVDLACKQAMAGHDVYFCSGGGSLVPLLEQHGVKHVVIEQDPRRPLAVLRGMLKLVRLCRGKPRPILHAHMMGGALIGGAVSRLMRIPMVTTVHNSFDGHSVLMRLGDRIVAVSEAECAALKVRKFPTDRLRVIWNAPVGSPRTAVPSTMPVPELVRPSITVICGLHRRKGVADVIDAFARISADAPGWMLNIAGEGPDRAALEQRVVELGLGQRVIFLGYCDQPEALYKQTDIFVLASYADPGSLTIGEARAAGCAIVATAVGGTPEMLEFGRAGLLVTPGDVEDIAAALRQLVCNDGLRAQMRLASLEGAEVFNVGRLVGEYDAVYEDAARYRGAASGRHLGQRGSGTRKNDNGFLAS